MRLVVFFILILIPGQILAKEKYNCKDVEKNINGIIQELNRKCASKNECKVDVLDYTACGEPIAHSDPEFANQIVTTRSQLHKMCEYVVAPCPSITSEVLCLNQQCETKTSFLKASPKLVVEFFVQDKPLANGVIILEADNGIRCVSAPCPATTEMASFTTNAQGQIEIDLKSIMQNPPSDGTPRMRVDHLRLNRMIFKHQNKHFANFDLYSYLVNRKPPYRYKIRW